METHKNRKIESTYTQKQKETKHSIYNSSISSMQAKKQTDKEKIIKEAKFSCKALP